MPRRLSSKVGHLSSSSSQRQCERTSFSFYRAVREQLPVWLLEELRSMEVFSWEDGRARAFLPSEALMYALVHDHQAYARFLLHEFSVRALQPPRCGLCRLRGGAPHLAVAVRYDRVAILGMVLEALKDQEAREDRPVQDFLDNRGGCAHVADGGKTLVQLAVELSRPDCLLLLLACGVPPSGLDAALQRLASCDAADRRHAQCCVDFLLLFLPEPPVLCRLQAEAQSLLGNKVSSWLCGLAPPPLLLQALRCLARSGPNQIPALPDFLQLHSCQ
ncbi:ankyrin repeat domain-containing protein 9 [Clinocottus analis]|uniref:ankyrin repeat domain-containing protein 9 n=1 Tax=Clinocottus analis TaxID=304258 RepID=UPI0035C174B2